MLSCRSFRRAAAPWLTAGLLLGACREPTQVKVELSTDIDCADAPETAIAVGRASSVETRAFATQTDKCNPDSGRIGSIVVVPAADNNGELGVRVVTGLTNSPDECVARGYTGGCVVARRILGFIPHETLHLPITLEMSCIDVPCDATQTCRHGHCVSATIVDPSQCTKSEGCDVGAAGSGSGGSAGQTAAAGSGGFGGVGGTAGETAGGGGGGGGAAGNGGSTGGAGSAGTAGGGGVAGAASHPGGAGPVSPVDATEVTRDAYAAWLATSPSVAGQPPYCSFNTDFTPACNWPPSGSGNYPVVCIDWCDAYAYCQAQGRRLCGKIGGGAVPFDQYADAAVSQWYAACTSGGQFAYPYGDTYDGTKCNGVDYGLGTSAPVGSALDCQSSVAGYDGVFDLSGNVFEWEDSCDGYIDGYDLCRVRGGAWASNAGKLVCAFNGLTNRVNSINANTGFRCCAL